MLLLNTYRKLKEKPIKVEDFQFFLASLFPSECIPKSSSVHELFEAITRQKLWDYWNYYQLEQIVQEFVADDREMISWMKTYQQDLKSFKATTKLIDHIPAARADSEYMSLSAERQPARYDQRYYLSLSIKLKIEFTDHTLLYIDDLWNEFADLYGLPPRVALFDHVRRGCVSIVWCIPSHLTSEICSAKPLSADFCCKHKIMRVEFGEKCIYQEEVSIPLLASVTVREYV